MTWTTTPTPPTRKTGRGWSTIPGGTQKKTSASWFSNLERVAPLAGSGNLHAVLSQRYLAERVDFDAEGSLTAVVAARHFVTANLTGAGLPTGTAFQTRSVQANLSGGGGLYFEVNDGLSAIIGVGFGANTAAAGTLSATVFAIGGKPDGLSATVRPVIDGLYAEVVPI